ncbi:MAG: dynamin family protein [Gammaproteobacteria bacterium]|uniref:dynamin family protein n=1 Tax=Rhodoferax sp. TaxID=50421 RepID=UPI0017E5B507|nr:dynamin family protein [Rhodoferax sp.]MBU3898610.1 dynamin family protein [Gammaproteobacteria bacterium]MBA3057436.1 dynamin family protein [Rhodoferax sp.]MBU3997713.1 dynamin family protein [Gammaproteobacteria bacterium]MBU4019519.1 dynamin family protein [Gammaproteobacteria bacterium]MBU4079033.1 dynamin family protein [Gammaproteobacteria bacterium]
MAISFNEQFDQHGAWRRELALRLKLLAEWLKDHELLDAAVEERLRRLEARVRVDKVMVAFVGEFSRGKSELINAIFFAGYGRRIMPASAGRTTMCPTEMSYDVQVPPCLRLLPIESRLQPQALMEWRMAPEKWTRIDLNVHDPKQLSEALEKVAETRHVTQAEANALGFWQTETPEDNPTVNAQGLVEIPRWRHALINIAHPLLKQGLVILDTPGLNAIGAEPELTVSLIPQAHAVVFILGADTGVTKSDLAIWREHLVNESRDMSSRLVVLNKIDTLWDALSSPAQVQAQIERQQASTAEILGVPREQVIPISAQKGLVAKVTDDAALLKQSCLSTLEDALSQGIMGQRQKMLGAAIFSGIADLQAETGRVIHIRRRDLAEQLMELEGLQGKNSAVIKNMRSRISQEQAEFDLGGAKIHAVRSVHLKLLREVFSLLGPTALKKEMMELTKVLQQKGIKMGVRRAYGDTFEHLRKNLQQVQSISAEIQVMLAATFRQLNGEHGFSLLTPTEPSLVDYLHDLDLVERSHLQYLSLGNTLRLAQPEFADRLVRALSTRLRTVHEAALSDIELWSKAAAAQLDVQLRERRRNFSRRLEAIDRIQQASGGLGERIDEIEEQKDNLNQLNDKLSELTDYLITVTDPDRHVVAAADSFPDIELV